MHPMTHFDPYQSWLGIPPHEQPPTHYRLLGVPLFESNPHVISHAAERQAHHIQNFLGGPYTDACYRILAELAAAQQCLLDPQQKAYYDHQLEQMLANRSERVVAAAPPPPSMPMPAPAYPQPMYQGPGGGYPMAGPPMPQPVPMHPTMPMATGYPMPAAMPASAPVSAYPAQPAAVAPRTAPASAPVVAPAGTSAAASPPPVGPPVPSPLASVLADETPAKRSRRLRKREKGLSKEAMAAGSILGVIALLAAIWIAVQSGSREKHGWDQLTPDGSENKPAKFVPKSDKEREKEKEEAAKSKSADSAKSKSADSGKSKTTDDGKAKSELPKLQPKAVPPADLRPKDRPRGSGGRRDRRPKSEEPPVAAAIDESPPHEAPLPATLSPKEKRKAERENLLPPLPEEIEN